MQLASPLASIFQDVPGEDRLQCLLQPVSYLLKFYPHSWEEFEDSFQVPQAVRRDQHFKRIVVLSDTHELLHEPVLKLSEGAQLILHAGDICSEAIINELELRAPVRAVLGNNDFSASFFESIPFARQLRFSPSTSSAYMVHRMQDVPQDSMQALCTASQEAEPDMLITGHSHVPHFQLFERQELDYACILNPGSASRSRSAYGKTFVRMAMLYKESAPACLYGIEYIQLDS